MFRTLVLTGALLAAPAAPAQDDDAPDGNKLVKVALVADRDAAVPGTTLTLAVKLSIEPKWHVYWQNPGDSGIPTKVTITAPAGYEVGPVRFPAPHRHDEEGDIVSFIHEGEIALLADVKVPASAQPGDKASFAVESRWLVCTDICVPGSGKAKLDVAIEGAAKPAREKEFAAWRAQMPKPWSELAKPRVIWSGDEARPVLQLVVPGAQGIEFFPLVSETMKFEGRSVDAGKQGASAKIEWKFTRKQPADKPLARGVLVVKTSEGEASYVLESAFDAK